jgi:hypothetical protein
MPAEQVERSTGNAGRVSDAHRRCSVRQPVAESPCPLVSSPRFAGLANLPQTRRPPTPFVPIWGYLWPSVRAFHLQIEASPAVRPRA